MKKVLLIILAVVVVLFIALIAVFYFQGDKIAALALEKTMPYIQDSVVQNLPEDLDEQQVRDTFAKVTDKIKSGDYNKADLHELMQTFKESMEDKNIDADEAEKMFKAAQKLAGE
ncbi:hypothetical protein JXO59_12080 [candidate division KSB1 bacterium]|nr:hypothetical protein [candidate division KSB1 bacterium]